MNQNITLYSQIASGKYSKLQKYDEQEFSGRKFQAIKANFNQDFINVRFQNGRYENCVFDGCIFNAVGLSGTHFLSCHLNNVEICDSNMQFCDFSRNCKLEGIDKIIMIKNSNLSQSMFHDSLLKNIHFSATTISQARLLHTTFQDVLWEFCTLQDNIFDHVSLKNVSLIGCNIEYSHFKNVRFENVKLPLHQLPYAFGLLDYLKFYPDEIQIGSTGHQTINTEEYIDLLPNILSYYLDMNEYFPAINIALFLEKYSEADELIDIGIKYYITLNDFRKIKGMCKLIADNPFYDTHYMTQLYFKLVEYYNKISVSEYEKYQYSLHINEIKKILTGFNDSMPAAQLYIKTDITSADIDSLGTFYQLIEQCLSDYGVPTEAYSIETRHNSAPLSFWVTLSQNEVATILRPIGILISVFTANPLYLQNAINVIGNISTIGSFAMQIGQAINNKKQTITSDSPEIPIQDIKYINSKHQVLKSKKISVDIVLPFFNFSYHTEERRKNQN